MLFRGELAGQFQIALSNCAVVRIGRYAENSVRVRHGYLLPKNELNISSSAGMATSLSNSSIRTTIARCRGSDDASASFFARRSRSSVRYSR